MKKIFDFFVIVFKGILMYFTSVKYFFKPEFIAKSYDRHLYLSYIINIFVMIAMFEFTTLRDTPFYFHVVVGGALMLGLNFVKEWVWQAFFKIEHDFLDMFFGSYGGLLSSTLVSIFYSVNGL